jgi:hypothetical protein
MADGSANQVKSPAVWRNCYDDIPFKKFSSLDYNNSQKIPNQKIDKYFSKNQTSSGDIPLGETPDSQDKKEQD